MIRTLFVFGTRPEAIKLCPIILHFRSRPREFQVGVVITAQHREMLDQVLPVFGVTPDFDLNVMTPGQTLSGLTARMVAALEPVLAQVRPDIVFVQGDTTTTLCGALAAFYARIPVAHVEAGLRTGDMEQPFPEEMNRVVASQLASLHFAVTAGSRENLLRQGTPDSSIAITGNSGIDAVLHVRDRLVSGALTGRGWPSLQPRRRLIVVTAHRRESFGNGFVNICRALRAVAARGDVEIVYPVHPNPSVSGLVREALADVPGIHLIEPLDYVSFVDLMRHAFLLLTDSGGVQEEGPSLGKPVIVMREKTERPEGIASGTSKLAGTSSEGIISAVAELLDNPAAVESVAGLPNPYGDGRASEKIAARTILFFEARSPNYSKS